MPEPWEIPDPDESDELGDLAVEAADIERVLGGGEEAKGMGMGPCAAPIASSGKQTHYRAYITRRLTLGLCIRCGAARRDPNSRVMCRPCLDKAVARVKAVRTRRKANGLCLRCEEKAVNESFCEIHRAWVCANRKRVRKAKMAARVKEAK